MSVALRVILLQIIAALGIAILGFLTYESIVNATYSFNRIDVSHHQIETLIEVSNASSQYSEDLAEYLLSGSPDDRAALSEAREMLRRSINKLEEAVIIEEIFLKDSGQPPDPATDLYAPQSGDGPAETQDFSDERERTSRIWALFRSLNQAIDGVVRLFEEGKQADAIRIFDKEIDGKIDVALDTLLRAAIVDETEEHQAVDRTVRAQIRLFSSIVAAAAVATILACVLLGIWVVRSLRQPITELLRGAEEFGNGNLNHKIAVDSPDEFGALAHRFNQMAGSLNNKQSELDDERDNLESQVQQRTAELATMNQNLTNLGELRTRFLADISHELRTPLTALRGEAEITLRQGRKPVGVYRDALSRIVQQSEAMTKLIDDLLLLARSETDDVLFTPKPISITPVLTDAARDAKTLGSERRIGIKTDITGETLWVEADPRRLKQAVMILLDNAIKYSAAEQQVGLSLAREGSQALITVTDQGVGIVEKDLPHVFKRFYRGQGASHASGNGLGLSIAKWVIEKHGGDISIESAARHGTEVRIRIPIKGVREDGKAVTG